MDMILQWDPTTGPARQGDCLLIAVESIPAEAVETPAEAGQVILAHSETGHHHAIAERIGVVAYRSGDPLVGWLRVAGEPAEISPAVFGVVATWERRSLMAMSSTCWMMALFSAQLLLLFAVESSSDFAVN